MARKPNARDAEGFTPLTLACAHRRKDAVEQLLGRGADPNLPTDRERLGGQTPLLCALGALDSLLFERGAPPVDRELVVRLLRAGADPDVPDRWGALPLLLAAGSPQLFDELLTAGASTNRETLDGVLCAAASLGQIEVVERTLALGSNVNAVSREQTALAHAAAAHDVATVRWLLDRGADANAPSRPTALEAPLRSNDAPAELLTLLTDRGARLDPEIAQRMFARTAQQGRADLAGPLLEAGADPMKNGPDGRPSICAAVDGGKVAFVEYVAELTDLPGHVLQGTRLLRAAGSGDLHAAKHAIERGVQKAELNAALFRAVSWYKPSVVVMLLEAGASACQRRGWPPQHLLHAALVGDDGKAVLEPLLDHGAARDLTDDERSALLERARAFGLEVLLLRYL